MTKRLLTTILAAITLLMTATAQTIVATHWPLDKSIKDLTVGTTAYEKATAATMTCEGTDVSKLLQTSVAFGSKLAFQNTITPQSYVTKQTGLQILRFKVQGAADGSDDYGMTLTIRPTDGELTYVPTQVSVSVASWLQNSNAAFEVVLRKLNADGEVTQTYELGKVKSHSDVNAQYDDVQFDVPATAMASTEAWQVVVRMAKGYLGGTNLAMGNVRLLGTATLGGTVQTSLFTATVSPENAGTVSPAQTSVITGDNVTCTATPVVGYAFEGWYVGGTKLSDQNPYTFSIQADTQAEARFSKLPEATLTYGTVTPGTGSVAVATMPDGSPSGTTVRCNAGTTVTLTATPAKGHYFVGWEDGEGHRLSTAEQFTFKLNSDMAVYGRFAMIDNYRADLVAFPGAEGFGRFTTGGRMTDKRGAKVYYVTRNDDCADNALVEGTLRWALRTGDDTPRTVLFRTCGTIYLTSNLSLAHPNVTIDGSTAPGGGVCIAGYMMKLSQPNVIIRHLRFRAGDLPNKSMTSLDVENTHHVILDHCSMSWSMEENLTMYDCDSTTVQWCIISEGLYNSKNSKGARSYATQWGGEHGTMHHCLISNVNNRTPRFNGVRNQSNQPGEHDQYVDNEFVNNVMFNWGKPNSIYGGECYTDINDGNSYNRVYMVNNYFRPGPTTKENTRNSRYFAGASSTGRGLGQWYLSGNKFELSSKFAPATAIWSNDVLAKVNADNLYGFVSGSQERAFDTEDGCSQAIYDRYVLGQQTLSSGLLTTETADEAYQSVTSRAGASLPRYDEVDRRLLSEAAGTTDPKYAGRTNNVVDRGLGIINSPADIRLQRHDEFYALDEATGQTIKTQMWPWLGMEDGEQLMQDTDQDGMPDGYERSVGLNPNDATDGYRLTGSGYSNLELFLNGVADGQIDLAPYKQAKQVERRVVFNATVDAAGSGDYTTIQAAVNAAEQTATKESPYYILVKAGHYEEHVEISKPYIHLTGQARDAVVVSDNKSKSYNANIGKTATVYVNADDVTLDNLTIRNTYGQGEQALALYTLGDRISVTQCRIEGWQDTYRTGRSGQRHLVRECAISGTTDFIYNAGDVFFDRDTLLLTNATNVIVAPTHINPQWGYVFHDTYITTGLNDVSVSTDLGRPWGDTPKVSFINTTLHNVAVNPAGWRDMGGLPVQMAEYNTRDAAGNAVDLSQRKTRFTADGKTVTSKAVLTEAEAATYTLRNVLSGSDLWDADTQGLILAAPRLAVYPDRLSWTDTTGQAVCYLVTVDGNVVLTTDEQVAYTPGSRVTIQAVSESGVLGRAIRLYQPTAVSQPTVHEDADTIYRLNGTRQSRLSRGVNIVGSKKLLKY